jgi:hypothetical protein
MLGLFIRCLLCNLQATCSYHPSASGFHKLPVYLLPLCGNMYSEDSRGLGMDSLVTLFCFVSVDRKHKIVDLCIQVVSNEHA